MAYGQKEPVYTAKELQQKLETQRIELKQQTLEDKVAAQDKSIDEKIVAQDKRIEDIDSYVSKTVDRMSLFTSVVSIFLAIVGILAPIGGYILNRRITSNKKLSDSQTEIIKKLKDQLNRIEAVEGQVSKIGQVDKKVDEILESFGPLHIKSMESVVIDPVGSGAKNLLDKIQSTNEEERVIKENRSIEEVIKEIDNVKTIDEYTTKDWFLKGYDAHQKRQYEDAIVYYRKATESKDFKIQQDNNKAITYNNWGIVLSDLAKMKNDEKLFESAIEKYDKATHIDKLNAFPYNNWGIVLVDLAQMKDDDKLLEESFEKFERATLLKVDYVDAYNNWGAALNNLAKMKGDEKLYEAAIEKYVKATQLKDDYAVTYDGWACTLINLANLRGSVKEDQGIIKEKLLKANSLDVNAGVYNFACLYSLLDEKDEAFKWLKKAMQNERFMRGDFETEPDLDNLRQDPRFEELLNKYRPLNGEE